MNESNKLTNKEKYKNNYTNSKKKVKRRIKWKNVILFLFIIIFFIIFIISVINIIKWKIDSTNTEKQINNINDSATVIEKEDTENTEIIEPEEEIPKSNPYWDYIKMNLIDVDFSELKLKNNRTVGWIQVNGTNVNYPFVQYTDNSYYLKHSFDNSYNSAGWVFMDYRNNVKEFNKNTIIYAHGRYDNTMFGSLRKILTSGWLNNVNNYVIKLSTEEENTLWQVFSVYRIPTTNDYLKIDFSNDEKFLEFANTLINRSAFNFNTTVSANDKILTLSTCYNDDDKVVLHAKLIKIEKKNNESR